MKNCILLRYSEIGLKGRQTRRRMEKTLARNIKECLKKENIPYKRIQRGNARIIVFAEKGAEELTRGAKVLTRVFGIASASPAISVDANIDDIKKTALSLYKKGSFRISCRRITKSVKQGSVRINEIVGEYIQKETEAKVKLKNPDINIGIEIIGKRAYLFTVTFKGPAGLPLGTQGKIVCIIEKSRSAIAAYLMMKRGSDIVPICFSKDAMKTAEHLHRYWAYGSPFKPELAGKTADKKKMYKKAESVAMEYGCIGIAVGEDTKSLKKIAELDNSISLMVLRPIVGYSREQLIEMNNRIMLKN